MKENSQISNHKQTSLCNTFDSRAFATTGANDEANPVTTGESEEASEANGIAKTVDFYGRNFIINKDVLIPRPETEQIIDAVLNLAGKPYLPGVKPGESKIPENPTIIDVGTGSGCIAITLKKELPKSTIYATDISEKALKVTSKNITKHSVSIHLIISHLLENVKLNRGDNPGIIVANLPYVDPEWDWLDKVALSHEPPIALYAEDHGLKLIKELIKNLPKTTKYLILEADPCQHQEIENYAKKSGLELVETRGFILTFCNPQVLH